MDDDQSFLPRPMLGTDESTIDSKGRILIRQKLRDALGPDFVLYLGELGCVVAISAVNWGLKLDEVSSLAPWDPGLKAYTRLVLDTAETELNCDAQGRVVICSHLKREANLVDNVLVVGCYDHLEIWSVEEYDKYREDQDSYSNKRRQAIREAVEMMNAEKSNSQYEL